MTHTLTCDRESLIMAVEGVFLEFDRAKGIHRIQDETAANAALEALENGETVALTVAGRIVSTCHLVEDGDVKRIVEEPVE